MRQLWDNMLTNPMGAATSQSGSFKPDIRNRTKDFKYPQVFRANLALEQMLPGDVKMTLEGIYSKTMNNVSLKILQQSIPVKNHM